MNFSSPLIYFSRSITRSIEFIWVLLSHDIATLWISCPRRLGRGLGRLGQQQQQQQCETAAANSPRSGEIDKCESAIEVEISILVAKLRATGSSCCNLFAFRLSANRPATATTCCPNQSTSAGFFKPTVSL